MTQLFENYDNGNCLFVFPKWLICSCGLEITSSQDDTITCLIIRYFATNIPTALIFKS